QGKLKSVDAAKNSLTILTAGRGGEAKEETFTVAKNAKVTMGREELKLADLKAGAQVGLMLSEDQKEVVAVHVRPALAPGLAAVLKSVDAKAQTVTLTGRGGEEKTIKVAADAKVQIDGKEAKLADLRPDDRVQLTLSEDRSTITAISRLARRPERER